MRLKPIPARATEHCIVSHGGGCVEVSLLYAITRKTIDEHLYGEVMPMDTLAPPTPTEDGEYFLIDNVWVRQPD